MNTPKVFDKVFGSLVAFVIGDYMGNPSQDTRENTDMMIATAKAYLTSCFNVSGQSISFEQQCCDNYSLWYTMTKSPASSRMVEIIATCFAEPAEKWKLGAQKAQSSDSLGLTRCLFPALLGDLPSAISQAELTNSDTTAIEPFYKVLQRYLYSTQVKNERGKPQLMPSNEEQLNVLSNSAFYSMSDSLESAILSAMDNKELSETVALTGALAGARFGFNRIPTRWIAQMSDSLYTELRSLAEEATKLIQNQEEQS